MLPDFPGIKEKLFKIHINQMKRSSEKSPILRKIQKKILHEGNRFVIVREDGSRHESNLKKEEAPINIPVEYITQGNQQKIFEIISDAANELNRKKIKEFLALVSKESDCVGNTVDAKGKALNPDHIYELIEKVQLDFDKNGNIENFEFICNPNMQEAAKKVFQEIECDPIQKQRFNELMVRKKEEWRDRESNRKLVG